MFPKRIWLILIILIIAFGFILQEGEGLNYLQHASRLEKHFFHFAFLVFFSGIGYLGWMNYQEKWIGKAWIIFYFIIFITVIIGGLIDVIFNIKYVGFRYFFGYIRTFGTTPLPYGICMFLAKMRNKQISPQ